MHTLRIYLLESKYEVVKTLRNPAYVLPTICFPVLFYVFFGVLFGRNHPIGGVTLAHYLIATYGTFGVIGASLFGLGVSVAIERGQGWMQLKRTTPMPLGAYFVSKLAVALFFSTAIVLALLAVGRMFGGVVVPIGTALLLLSTLVGGSITFCALGLAIGYFTTPSSAAPIANLFYLPLSVLSGLWMPIEGFPHALQTFATYLPPFHLAQLALQAAGAPHRGTVAAHVISLAISALVFLWIARAGFRRESAASFG
jgi:ABC-2 type transport system permease protein